MFDIPFLSLFILASVLGASTGQSCDKSSYLTEGLACKLDIFLRSEGESDSNLTVAKGSSFLIVNGIDYSSKSQGINVAVFDQQTGIFMTAGVFDVKASSANGDSLKSFINALPNDVIVVMAVQTSGNANSNLAGANDVLTNIGVNDTAIGDQESFAAVLCKGSKNCKVKQAKNTKSNGPTFVSLTISLPFGYIPNESLRSPFFDVALTSNGATCSKASGNAADCVKILDGLTSTEWVSTSQGVGATVQIHFPAVKINKVNIYQRSLSTAQIKDVRLDFSDCSTVHVALTNNKNSFEEFHFSARVATWVKFTVTTVHSSTNPVGFKSIQLLYDEYESDTICDHATLSSAGTSNAYPLLSKSMSLRVKGQDAVIILATTASATGSRYEIVFDQASDNKTYVKRSQDGSSPTTVAQSVKKPRYVGSTSLTHVWMDWTPQRVVIGIGERIILYYRDESPLTAKYLFLKTQTNGEFEVCDRPDYRFRDANHFWPMDKIMLNDLINFKKGTSHGPMKVETTTGNLSGFSSLAVKFDGTNWIELGDFKGECISNPDLCEDGLTVLLRFTRAGSGERFILSSNGENGPGFAISHTNTNGKIKVEIRDGIRYWYVDETVSQSGQQMLAFTWSKEKGLAVVVGYSDFSVYEDAVGLDWPSSDESTKLFVGKPSKLNTKYFQGKIDSIAVFYKYRSAEWMKNFLKGNVLSGFTSSCNQQSPLDHTNFYFPALDPTTMSPNQCREQCSNAYSHKAVITDGAMCTCVNNTSSMTIVANELCDVPCTGAGQLKCGGTGNKVYLLDSASSKPSIVCNYSSTVEPFNRIEIQITANKPFYDAKAYVIDAGDGEIVTNYKERFAFSFINTKNTTISPQVKFMSNETGEYVMLPCSNSLMSLVTTKNLSISCPPCAAVNQDIDCNITYSQSQDDTVMLNSDGTATTLPLPGSALATIGAPCTKRSSSNAVSGLHILPFPVDMDGKLVALDIDIIKQGYLEVKCLQVVCDNSSRYCPSQRACVAKTTACQVTGTTCPSSKTLDMTTGYCSNSSCEYILPAQTTSNIKYKPKFNLIIWANAGHRRLITLNTSVETSSCNFFGVHIPETHPATLSFTKCNNCALFFSSAKVKAVNQTGNIYPGYQSPALSNGPALNSEVPNVKLHVLPKGRTVVKLKFSTDGGKSISLTSSKTGLSSTIVVHSQHILQNLTFSSTPAAHPTNKLSNVSLLPHLTSNATYQWMFNDTNVTTHSPWIMYSCPKAGMNSLTLLGSNCMSLSYAVCEILCQDEIDNLEFASQALDTVAENEMTKICFLLRNGSHVNITIDPGDGSGLKYLNNAKVSGATLVACLNKTYTTKDVYQVNITACNLINCKSLVGNITVQSKIANLTMSSPKCTATNSTVNFTSTISQGCDVQYSWKTEDVKKTTELTWFGHVYHRAGLYNASVIAYNNVSTALISCQGVLIQDPIEGVKIYPVEDSGIPQLANIRYTVEGGSSIQTSVCFGDGHCEVKNGTSSAEGSHVYNGSFSHNYTKEGDYIANLTFCNCIGCNSTTVPVHVEVPVRHPKVTLNRKKAPTVHMDPCSSRLYVLTNETVYMVADTANGTNVKVLWSFGDGAKANEYKEGEFNDAGAHANHSYSKSGNYTITVTLENQNGKNMFSCAIVVQDPVHTLKMTSNSPQGYPYGSLRIQVDTIDPRPSDPIHCFITFGDGNRTGLMHMSYDKPQAVAITHYYPNRGLFTAYANCSNAVSSASISAVQEIQNVIYSPRLRFFGTAEPPKRPWVEEEGYNGPNVTGSVFPLPEYIMFESTSFNGTNRTCTYSFAGDPGDPVIRNTSCGNITHKFTTAGVKTVSLDVSNNVSSKRVKMNLTVDESTSCNKVEVPEPQKKGNPHIIKASPTNLGPNWCCLFKYQDTTKADLFGSGCTNELIKHVEGVNTLDIKKIDKSTLTGNHTFPTVGEYKNMMYCWNRVSECQEPFATVVVNKPCKQPIVGFETLSLNKTRIQEFKKSEEAVILTDNTVDCEASKKSKFTWKCYEVDSETFAENEFNLTGISTGSDTSTLTFKKLALKYGLYKCCFTLNMTEMIGVEGSACGYFKITPSQLIAKCKGGSSRVYGYNQTKELDCTESDDPDTADKTVTSDNNIKCNFFCKAEGDNYTFPDCNKLDENHLPPVPSKPVITGNATNITRPYLGGCFGYGPGRLESKSHCRVKLFTGHMLENTTYTLKMCMRHKDGRKAGTEQTWKIKEGNPPVMLISCATNCGEKLNPSGKTTFTCKCEDCPSNTQVFYKWSICKDASKENCKTIDDKELLTKYLDTASLEGRNLAVSANKLAGGISYRFICRGWRGRKSGTPGEANEMKTVNVPPQKGTCTVSPTTGTSMNTTFTITCKDWEDTDMPLTYSYGYVKKCSEKGTPSVLDSDLSSSEYRVQVPVAGDKKDNHLLHFTVHVADKYKAFNKTVCIPVTVKEQIIELKDMEKLMTNNIENMLASGSASLALNLVRGIGDQLKTQAAAVGEKTTDGDGGGQPAPTKSPDQLEKEKEKRKELVKQCIDVLVKVPPKTLSAVVSTSQTFNNILEVPPDEVNEAAKEAAANVLEGMSGTISSKASEGAEPEEVRTALGNVLGVAQNFMTVLSKTTPSDESPTSITTKGKSTASKAAQTEEEKKKTRDMANKVMGVTKQIADSGLQTMSAGEKPLKLTTPGMEMQLNRQTPQSLANATIKLDGGLSAQVPSILGGKDKGGGEEPPPTDSMAMMTSNNVFNFGKRAELTTGGNFVNLEYLNSSTKKPLKIENLKEPFLLVIPRQDNPVVPSWVWIKDNDMNYYSFELQQNDSAITIFLFPNTCDYGFTVYIKKDSYPKEDDYDMIFHLPHDDQWDFETNCSKDSNNTDPFKLFLSPKTFNHSGAGQYKLGFVPKPRNGSGVVSYLPGNATMMMFTSMCVFWNPANESWLTDGCEVTPETTPDETRCLCNHLTSFTTSCIVPPNAIDWNKVLNPSIEDLYVIVTTVAVVYAIYFICLVFARRADRRDAEKTGVCPLPDNDPRDNYCYEIHVHTGFVRGAGTSAEVSIVMNGSVGDSDPRVLKDSVRKVFRTGGVDAFLMTAPQSLGVLRNIRIWHNNAGDYPSWNLLRIMIQDLQSGKRWWFVCDEWLAVDEGDGKIERILYPATSNDLTKFNVLFATEIRKNLTDGHLWFSVVTRPARSTFTRVQRLTCCLSILLTSMLANMMFYRNDPQKGPKGSIQIAGFSFSLEQVSIGITSSLVVFPANLIIVQLFRKARAKEVKNDIGKYDDITHDDEDIEYAGEADADEKAKKPAKKEGLPYWFNYVAYVIAFMSCAAATVVVVFYGITFGEEKTGKWLMSMTISLVQDVLISQPIKIFILASMFALLIKDPNKAESDPITDANKLSADEEWLHKNVKDLNDDEKQDFKKLITDRPPDEAKLEIARQLRMKEKQMKSIIRELVWYLIFLLVILTISYGNRDPDTYRITKYMEDLFVKSRYNGTKKFTEVQKIDDYWNWMNETVIPSIYKEQWYNSDQTYPVGFLADTPTDYLLAVVRLRQLRIKKDSCTYLPVFKHVITECNDFYNSDEEDRAGYLQNWVTPPDVNTTMRPPGAKKTAWEYQTGSELKTFPYWGYKATYNAGGYAKELPTNSINDNINKAYSIVAELKSKDWIDRYTRAIFTELAIYNANTNFFCVITLLYEQLPTGALFNYPSILTLKLYRYVGGDMYFVMACEITYLLFTLFFIFRELKKAKKEGLASLKNIWSLSEIFITMLSLSLVVLYFLRIKFTDDAVAQMRADHSQFVSFNYTAFLDEWINALMGFVVFLSFIKIIRLLRFNRRMSLLAQTLRVCIPRIAAFLVIYGSSFFAFSLFGCLVFGQDMEGFGTILRSATTLMDTILGKFQLREMTNANRIIGPFFFYFYTVVMVFILINMFLSIINDSFAEVNRDVNKQSNDYEIVDFMVHRLKENIGKTMGNAIVPIYKEPKTKLEKDFDAIEENADNIMHHMRNLTFENMRHTRWFDANASKEKKKKMFEILMEVDWDYFEDELGDSIPVFEDFLSKYDEKRLQSVHESYRYKKLRDHEIESKMSSVVDSDTDEESSDSDNSDGNSDAPSNASGDEEDDDQTLREEIQLEIPSDTLSVRAPSPGLSIRGMYGLPARSTSATSKRPESSLSTRKTPIPTLTVQAPTISLATDVEMSKVLEDVERERCATDAELNSFLPEIRSVDENNIPQYESDPEQVKKKSKKKKKTKPDKKKKDQGDPETFSIKSKPAWGDSDTMMRKSPAGSSEKDRLIPDGEDNKGIDSQGRDNDAFDGEPQIKEKRKKKKKRKQSDV